jgi:hypothetical protein
MNALIDQNFYNDRRMCNKSEITNLHNNCIFQGLNKFNQQQAELKEFLKILKDYLDRGLSEIAIRCLHCNFANFFSNNVNLLLSIYKSSIFSLLARNRYQEACMTLEENVKVIFGRIQQMNIDIINLSNLLYNNPPLQSSSLNKWVEIYNERLVFLIGNILEKEVSGNTFRKHFLVNVNFPPICKEMLFNSKVNSCLLKDSELMMCEEQIFNLQKIELQNVPFEIIKIPRNKLITEEKIEYNSEMVQDVEMQSIENSRRIEDSESQLEFSKFQVYISQAQKSNLYQILPTPEKAMYLNKIEIEPNNSEVSFQSSSNQGQIQVDPNSNINLYKKEFIPKTKKQPKARIEAPKFNTPNFKKENIDKKILRKFRSYLKSIYKTHQADLISLDPFWRDFCKINLLPPMKYIELDKAEKIEFKSFNAAFLQWFFNKRGSMTLFQEFTKKYGGELYRELMEACTEEDLREDSHLEQKLTHYIQNMDKIYSQKEKEIIQQSMSCYMSSHTRYEDECPELNYNNLFDLEFTPKCRNQIVLEKDCSLMECDNENFVKDN